MGLEETINERINRGFLSDRPESKKQIFFAAYDRWKDSPDDDGQFIQKMEHEAGVTAEDWREYQASFSPQF